MPTYKTEAIILKKKNYREADQILTVFSKNFGKLTLLARGIRKTKSRKRGNLELTNQADLFIAKGKTWDIISEVEVLNSFTNLKEDLGKSVYTFQILELIDRLTMEEQEHLSVYNLLLNTLEFLNNSEIAWEKKDLLLSAFSIRLLLTLGFWEDQEVGNIFSLSHLDLQRLVKIKTLKYSEIIRLDADLPLQKNIKKIVDDFTVNVLESKLRSRDLINYINKLN